MPGGPDLPRGIVTFVFTDVEGSTRLLRRLGDAYPDVLERHFTLLRQAWAAHAGHEIDTAGDSDFVAFRDATAAVEACAEAQRLLGAEPWPEDGEMRARMGIHTGLASPIDGSYRALAVHQAARVMSAAHGGQVLVSGDTVARLSALRHAAIVPVGRYRLRDFDDPPQLFSLVEPAGAPFPAVRALPADGHNLVPPPTSFVGRDAEVDALAAAVGPGALVTLAGPGGVGKTRLAMEVGLRTVSSWPDGVWFVDLAPIDDAALIGPAIGSAVGAPNRGDDRWSEVLAHLRDRQALVILDNCEHLSAACAVTVADLLASCRACGVLATSREPLGASGESVRRIRPLESSTTDSPAVELFLDRAVAARPDLVVDGTTATIVAEICRHLDGLPLALELAAARLGALSPADVLRGLSDRFRLLRSRNPTMPERQRTMEALLEWSDRLLEDDERAALRRLSVLGGGFSVDAAVAAVGGDGVDPDDVPELVWSLVEKSLIAADLRANETRYRLLESVRDFAAQRLRDAGERDTVAARLVRWYLGWLGPGCYHRGWAGDVADEVDNLRALIPLVAPEQAQQLAYTVARHLDARNAYREAIDELTRHVEELTAATPSRISLLTTLVDLHLRLGDVLAAKTALGEAEALHEAVGALPEWDDVAIERARGELARRWGDPTTAVDDARRALERDLSLWGQARMWNQLGVAAGGLGDFDAAEDAFRHELAVYEQLGDERFEAGAHGNLAEAALRRGDVVTAARHQRACLEQALHLGTPVQVAFSEIVAARIAATNDDWETAARLHGHADGLLDETGAALYDDDRVVSEQMLDRARAQLGDTLFEATRAAGRALTLPAAAALADHTLAGVAQG